MIQDIRGLVAGYAEWVRDKSVIREIEGGVVEITTPYLDRHNDYLQIYAQKEKDGIRLTDGGEVIADLRSEGCDLDTDHRRRILRSVLNGFGVHQDGDEIFVRSSSTDFPLRKHNLVQALLAVNDLFFLASPIVNSLFLEDVTAWLRAHDVRFVAQVRLAGKSGLDHSFDFVVPASAKRPERIVRASNKPSRDFAKLLAFSWVDTREVRNEESRLYAILNDANSDAAVAVTEALSQYEITAIRWSDRERFLDELAG